MSFGALSFLSPLPLLGLLALPVIWWLLRATPPSPQRVAFPPTKILKDLLQTETSPVHSPWWLTLLRLMIASLVILALARPILNHDQALIKDAGKTGPLVLLVDNGWQAADQWARRKEMMQRLIREAEAVDRLVYIVPTANIKSQMDIKALRPDEGLTLLERLSPSALSGDRIQALRRLEDSLTKSLGTADAPLPADIFYLSNGLSGAEDALFFDRLKTFKTRGANLYLISPPKENLPLGVSARLGKGGALYGVVNSVGLPLKRRGELLAFSGGGDVLGRSGFELAAGVKQSEIKIDLPLEIRNQIARLQINGVRSAGAVHLMDQRSHWRRVGLLSNERGVMAQPLLSPLYYINRALEPYAEIVTANEPDMAEVIETFADRNVSVIVMSDIGRLIGSPLLRLTDWVEAGGVLVRFAGPHMEKSQDQLLPTPLRQGGRRLGGALSWSKPQQLMPFDDESPFAGLAVSDDIVVRRQLLADPSRLGDNVFIWARLKDGTPLVTARREVNGWVVLVHVTANADWSSLPLSGLFVDMLRRLTQLSLVQPVLQKSQPAESTKNQSGEDVAEQNRESGNLLAPLMVLDGFGILRKPGPTAQPVAFHKLNHLTPSSVHPPGFYGPDGQSVALNVFPLKHPLAVQNVKDLSIAPMSYQDSAARHLRAPLLLMALILLMIDCVVVMWMRGALRLNPTGALKSASPLLALMMCAFIMSLSGGLSQPVAAQDTSSKPQKEAGPAIDQRTLKAALATHLAYVVTGDQSIDEVSLAGLKGLTYVLNQRTAVEPQDPIGVNISRDELAFYPVLYWPVGTYTKPLDDKVVQRINAYMKHGGMIIFDTKDQDSRIGGLSGTGYDVLKQLLAKLDIPRLEPVPKGHVLTKSFYLLSRFPGRFQGGELWVEATSRQKARSEAQVSEIDGVSTLLITSNDFASAWAIDASYQPMFPVVPGGHIQREMAYRVGVNIVMYALAGNYKADQVHVPALLERLGQ